MCREPAVDGQFCLQGCLRGGPGQFHCAQISGDTLNRGVEGTGAVRGQNAIGFPMPELGAVLELGRAVTYGGGLFVAVAASGTGNLVMTSMTVPAAPTSVGATAGNTKTAITWTAPTDNGGSAITGYTVTSTPGSFPEF